eukprot:TRINITY_DN14950_c0_g4_i1.p1 TRINITY_DN14950_c0_g4~~TRINITY_DN14950_c0_g4_i1.p1  ORF type:complete len:614 (-),score=162.39 TRINITY_DN14950_c0_g4_i1:358-2199(-)
MPIIFEEDEALAREVAVKKGRAALGSTFKDHPEDDPEFRLPFRIAKVEFGDGLVQQSIQTRVDESSEVVTIPNPAWGMSDDFMELMECMGGKRQKLTKTVKTKRFKTELEFIIRKLSGTVGINVVKTDFKKIVGKKHVKKKRPQPESFGFGFFDDEDMQEESNGFDWSIPGLDSIHARAELSATALEINDVAADEQNNMLTITFKHPLRVFTQHSQNKDGEITYAEMKESNAERASASSRAASSRQTDALSLGRELVALSPSTMKIRLHFNGEWDDEDELGDESEGKQCLQELKDYLDDLRKLDSKNEQYRQAVQEVQKKRDELKGRSFKDLPADSFGRKVIADFNLDVSSETGHFDACTLEEEWKAFYELRKKAEAEEEQLKDDDSKEEEEDDDDDEYMDELGEDEYYESNKFHRKLLKELRTDFKKALASAGIADSKAETAAKGLFLKSVDIAEDGDGDPRTCTVNIWIFSAVGKANFVEIEHEHHARARMSFCEEHAYINAEIHEFNSASKGFRVVEDLAGTRDDFALFNMDCHHDTGMYTYKLCPAKEAQKLVAAIFGQKATGRSRLDDGSAYRILMSAAGVEAKPFTDMDYMDFDPLGYVDVKYPVKK